MILTTSHGPQSHYECTPGAGSTGQHRTRPLSMGSPRSTQEERTSHVTATAPQAGALRGGTPIKKPWGCPAAWVMPGKVTRTPPLELTLPQAPPQPLGLSLSLRFTLLLSFPARHEVILALTAPPSAGFAKAVRAKRTTSRTLGFTFCIFKGRRQGKRQGRQSGVVITSINERPEAPGKKHPFQTNVCQHAEVTLLK